MEIENKSNILKKIKAEHKGRRWYYSTLVALTILALILAIAWLIIIFSNKMLFNYNICRDIFGIGSWLALSLFLLLFVIRKRDIKSIACNMDSELKAKNRLETFLELKEQDHPLKKAQQEDATQFFADYKMNKWQILKYAFIILFLLQISLGTIISVKVEGEFYTHIKQQETALKDLLAKKIKAGNKIVAKKKKKPKINNKKKVIETASLKLIAPESELKQRPLDEIEWQGVGKSVHGFQDLKLIVCKNGKEVTSYKINKNKTGKIKFSAMMALDEFDAMPFDLISYYLLGKTKLNNDNIEILSMPQFIEVTRFQEDMLNLSGGGEHEHGGEEKNKSVDMLVNFLNMQVLLNKATFRARIAQRMKSNNDSVTKLSKIYEDQSFLLNQLSILLDDGSIMFDEDIVVELKDLPAESVNCLEKAAVHIKVSLDELKNTIAKIERGK